MENEEFKKLPQWKTIEYPWYTESVVHELHTEFHHEDEIKVTENSKKGKIKVAPLPDLYHTDEMIEALQTHWVSMKMDDKIIEHFHEVLVQVKECGNITELILHDSPFNKTGYIKRLDKEHYMDMRDGQIKEYNHEAVNRSQNAQSVRRSISNLRDLINSNAQEPKNLKWVTLTYAENMTDSKRLYDDYSKFWKRFKRYCEKNNIPSPEYISVAEPQARGAWHLHIIFIWQTPAPFIPNDEISRMWSQGFTSTKACSDSDNLGAYLSAYLADMPIDGENQDDNDRAQRIADAYNLPTVEKSWTDSQGNIKSKRFVKGARLYLYPNGMNLYRCTQGIKKPITYESTYDDVKEKISDFGSETFSKSYQIQRDGVVSDTITKKYYNKSRK